MNRRIAMIGAACVLLVAIAGGFVWRAASTPDIEAADDGWAMLPVAPIPPRIPDGPDYERCLGMLVTDPDDAASFAEAWVAKGGGDGAGHCLALSKIAQGSPADGAAMLEQLAGS